MLEQASLAIKIKQKKLKIKQNNNELKKNKIYTTSVFVDYVFFTLQSQTNYFFFYPKPHSNKTFKIKLIHKFVFNNHFPSILLNILLR